MSRRSLVLAILVALVLVFLFAILVSGAPASSCYSVRDYDKRLACLTEERRGPTAARRSATPTIASGVASARASARRSIDSPSIRGASVTKAEYEETIARLLRDHPGLRREEAAAMLAIWTAPAIPSPRPSTSRAWRAATTPG
jgi:hypothetical protein